jgi:hypothetical protein
MPFERLWAVQLLEKKRSQIYICVEMIKTDRYEKNKPVDTGNDIQEHWVSLIGTIVEQHIKVKYPLYNDSVTTISCLQGSIQRL